VTAAAAVSDPASNQALRCAQRSAVTVGADLPIQANAID